MSVELPHRLQNRILAALPAEESGVIVAKSLRVALESRQILYEPGQTIHDVYFPNSGVVSWLAEIESGARVEVATIGIEGLVGFRALLDADTSPARVMVQVPGQGLRIGAADLKAMMSPGSSLMQIVHRYVNAFLTQVTQSVACNTFHSVQKRFCRWLLMTHDRVQSDHFPLTHELMAQMLGVRRASVSEAAQKLQTAGLIHYVHGKVTVLDRAGLEAASCGCYRTVKLDYDELLGERTD